MSNKVVLMEKSDSVMNFNNSTDMKKSTGNRRECCTFCLESRTKVGGDQKGSVVYVYTGNSEKILTYIIGVAGMGGNWIPE